MTDDGLFKLDLSYFSVTHGNVISYGDDHIPVVDKLYSAKFADAFGPERKKEEELTQYHKDMASSVQAFAEQIIFHLLQGLARQD